MLARIHRLTLDRLRSEIEPVSAQDYMRYLIARQHVAGGRRLEGKRGVLEAIAQLQGFEVAAAAWERDVLPSRVLNYDPRWLDELSLSGEVAWARLSLKKTTGTGRAASPQRATPITLALRRDLGWLLESVRGVEQPEDPATGAAAATLDALRAARGAVLRRPGAGEPAAPGAARRGAVGSRGARSGDGRRLLVAAADHDAGGIVAGAAGAAALQIWRTAVARGAAAGAVGGRCTASSRRRRRRTNWRRRSRGNCWRATAWSSGTWWRARTSRCRGATCCGRCDGWRCAATCAAGASSAASSGEQYALPEAVDGLRRVRREERTGETVRINAADPLNLVGIITPGPRVASVHTNAVVFRDGLVVSVEEGRKVTSRETVDEDCPTRPRAVHADPASISNHSAGIQSPRGLAWVRSTQGERQMEYGEVVRRRRMVRAFDSTPIPRDIVERLLNYTQRGPSSGFSQGFEFLVFDGVEQTTTFWDNVDPAMKVYLSGAVAAPLIIVPFAHEQTYVDRYRQADKAATGRERGEDFPAPYWFIDSAFASMLVLLGAIDEGLGAFYFSVGANRKAVDEFLARLAVPAGYLANRRDRHRLSERWRATGCHERGEGRPPARVESAPHRPLVIRKRP